MGLFPYTQQTELLNTAVLDGGTISAPVEIFAAYASGQILSYSGPVSCTSSDPSALGLDSTCSNMQLSGSETTGRETVNVTFTADGQSVQGVLPVRIFYPQLPLTYTITETELNRIQYSLITPSNCIVYQRATVSISTSFLAGSQMLPDVLLDDILIPTLTVNDTSVAVVAGNVVHGRGPGVVEMCSSDRRSLGCVEITVSDEPVGVAQLVGSLLVELSLQVNSTVAAGVVDTAAISARSEFQFEQERGSLLVAALYSDGSYSSVSAGEVELLPSSNVAVYDVQDRHVVAVGNGESNGSFTWRPLNGGCNLAVTQTFPISVSLPQPVAVQTSLLPSPVVHFITTPASAAALVGIPTQLALQVELEYPSGQRLDVTSDTRVTYSISSNSITIDRSGVITTSSQAGAGTVQLTVQFSGSEVDLAAVVLIKVVQATALHLLGFPYPFYPGSETSPTTTLNPIENTGVFQRVSLQVQLMFSDNTTRDVTSHASTRIVSTTFTGTPNPQISSNYVLSVFGGGVMDIMATFGPESVSVLFQASGVPVQVSAISLNPIPSNTLKGVRSVSTTQLSANVTFSDGTQFIDFPVYPAFTSFPVPGLVNYSSPSASSAFSVSQGGVLQPLMNTIDSMTVQATAGTRRLSAMTSFVVNLDPDVGDVDLGQETGVSVPQTQAGVELLVPVRVNTGGRNLGSIEISVFYDNSVLFPVAVDLGPDWNGLNASSLNDSPGEIRFGGATSVNGIAGTSLHIFSLRLRVIGAPSSSRSFLRGTIETFAERNIDGTTIGPQTPHPIIAGDLIFEILSSVGKRSVDDTHYQLDLPSPFKVRERRAAGNCPSPPCVCSGQCRGDTDGNCVFDARDVTFTLIYITESLLGFSQPVGQEIQRRITSAQLEQLDPTLDGIVNTNDAYFLLRAIFRLVYFLQSVRVTPVQDTSSFCLLTINVQLQAANNRSVGQVEVVTDVAFTDSNRQAEFESSVVVKGSLLSSKGSALHGGLLLAERTSEDVFTVQLEPNFVANDVGVSIFVVSFDFQNSTDTARSAQFLGPPPPTYTSSLDLILSIREVQLQLAALSGYSPLQTISNTLYSSQCSDFPLLSQQLNVTFVSPFQADLEWNLLNNRVGLDFTSALWLNLVSCSVDQTGSTNIDSCTNPDLLPVQNDTKHSLEVRPFRYHSFQIIGQTTNTTRVEAHSPEAAPEGLQLPTYTYFERGVNFMWNLPASPNGVISHYTLYLGNVVIYNGTSLSHALEVDFTQPMNYSLEAFNSAGSVASDIGIVIPPTPFTVALTPTLNIAITDIIAISAVLTIVVLVVLLSAMAYGTVRVRQAAKEKPPSFVSLNFSTEIDGVVGLNIYCDSFTLFLEYF